MYLGSTVTGPCPGEEKEKVGVSIQVCLAAGKIRRAHKLQSSQRPTGNNSAGEVCPNSIARYD